MSFLEVYEKLNEACKLVVSHDDNSDPVHSYIVEMENYASYKDSITNWNVYLQYLREYQNIYNQVKENQQDTNNPVDDTDIEWINGFVELISKKEDPISLVQVLENQKRDIRHAQRIYHHKVTDIPSKQAKLFFEDSAVIDINNIHNLHKSLESYNQQQNAYRSNPELQENLKIVKQKRLKKKIVKYSIIAVVVIILIIFAINAFNS